MTVWRLTKYLVFFDPLDSVLEDRQTITEFFGLLARPLRVLGESNMPLGVGHEGEDTPGGIADSGNIVHRPIGIMRVTSLHIAGLIGIIQYVIYLS